MIKRYLPTGHPDRETAALWVDLYRKALAQPDGVYAEYDVDGHPLVYIDSKNPRYLVDLLDNLSRYGTLENRRFDAQAAFVKMSLRGEYKRLRGQGASIEDALEMLANQYRDKGRGFSRSSIKRKLGLK